MTQLISNLLMQPRPDAVERLTLIEKLELEKECWHDDGENNVHRIIDDCIDIVKQHSDWISVDERLPEAFDNFLAYATEYDTGYQYQVVAYFDGNRWLDIDGGINFVTHWMPLPKPPSEVKE